MVRGPFCALIEVSNMKTQLILALSVSFVSASLTGQSWLNFSNATQSHVFNFPGSGYDIRTYGTITTPEESEADCCVADFDQSGADDVVVVRKEQGYGLAPRQHSLLLNRNGVLVDGTPAFVTDFLNPANYSSARDCIACDVNGDGWPDLVIGNTNNERPHLYINRCDDKNGTWRGLERVFNWYTIEAGVGFGMDCCGVTCGDVDGDGDMDLYFANYLGGLTDDIDRLLINNGTGRFDEETSVRIAVQSNLGVTTDGTFRDFDLDGDLDLFLTEAVAGGHRLLFNNGSGVFTRVQGLGGGGNPYMHAVIDIASPGRASYYSVGDQNDASNVATGIQANGNIQFAGTQPIVGIGSDLGGNTTVCDMDLDGKDDLILCDLDTISAGSPSVLAAAATDGITVYLLRNIYSSPTSPAFDNPNAGAPGIENVDGTWDTCCPDVNGDGKPDLVVFHVRGMSLFLQL